MQWNMNRGPVVRKTRIIDSLRVTRIYPGPGLATELQWLELVHFGAACSQGPEHFARGI